MNFGGIKIDWTDYASMGNAILGIRDSGKTGTAHAIAEHLMDGRIPFTAFDPSGVWKYLRVPGKGKGYPVVVAGGDDGDIPLTPATAPQIVEAAMHNGVSLVVDLYSMELSKADWRRIVRDCVTLLLYKNKPHGLRHVFIEEAADFVPQRVRPGEGEVYAAVEKLARVGGNSRLGYTLISQRAAGVNKEVLELCDNLLLHRQKGKNSIISLEKWLDVGEAQNVAQVRASLSKLPTGQCWAWMREAEPRLIRVPLKSSAFPNRRQLRGAKSVKRAGVDVQSFVGGLLKALPKIEAETKANDPAELKKRIADLERQLKAKPAPAAIAAKSETPTKARVYFERGRAKGWAQCEKEMAKYRQTVNNMLSSISRAMTASVEAVGKIVIPEFVAPVFTEAEVAPVIPIYSLPGGPSNKLSDLKVSGRTVTRKGGAAAAVAAQLAPLETAARSMHTADGAREFTMPERRVMTALAELISIGFDKPTRPQLAAMCGLHPTTSTFTKPVSALKTAGIVDYDAGRVWLTGDGHAAVNVPAAPTVDELHAKIMRALDMPQRRVFDAMLPHGNEPVAREKLAEAIGLSPTTSTFTKPISALRTREVLDYGPNSTVFLQPWVFQK